MEYEGSLLGTSSQSASVSSIQKQDKGLILIAVNDLNQNLADLAQMVKDLEDKINPVLAPQYDEQGNNMPDVSTTEGSSLTSALRSLNYETTRIFARLNNIKGRVEL